MQRLGICVPWNSPFVFLKFAKSALNLQPPDGYEVRWFFGEGWAPARRIKSGLVPLPLAVVLLLFFFLLLFFLRCCSRKKSLLISLEIGISFFVFSLSLCLCPSRDLA